MLKNYLFSPLCLAPFLCSSPLFLFLSAPYTSFSFLFPGQPPLFLLLFSSSLLFLFFWSVALYFSAQNTFFPAQTFFSPKTLFSVQNVFDSAQNFFQFSPKRFFFFFSVQPLFSSSFFCFILFWFSPLFFLFQRLLFFFSLAPFIQDPIFSLAASHLFYLNKSLFSSNLE